MEDEGEAMGLQEYMNTVDQSSLPRILKVCSGVYFQGSVYEISGCEVCLSTGDLIKIIDIKLLSVSCEDISNNTTFELPIDHSGLFKLVPEELPYSTIEEIVGLLPVGVDACGSFTFVSTDDLIIENLTLPAGQALTFLSEVLGDDGTRYARCRMIGQQEASAEVYIPLSCCGEFYECEHERSYSLQEIILSDRLCKRRFCKTTSNKSSAILYFSPIYQVQAIMHMRKDIVKFPSSLEVDVIDVTEQCRDLTFVTPLSIAEVAAQPMEAFPTMAEILEEPEANPIFCSSWFNQLRKGKLIILHSWHKTHMVLACTPKGRKAQQYFLLSQDYGGQMRKRPREFSSVYELYMAFSQSPGLRVTVTKNCEASEEDGVPTLSVGDQLEVLSVGTMSTQAGAAQNMESLVCKRILDEDDDEDDIEDDIEDSEVNLPLFTPANFVEKLLDKKKYVLADLSKNFSFPMNIKVASQDKMLEKDPLIGLPTLRLEEVLEETAVIASLPDSPERCFELPVRWLQISLSFTADPLPWLDGQTPNCYLQTVTELTEHFYHKWQALTPANLTPPPRPPKRKPSTIQSQEIRGKPKVSTPHGKSNIPTDELDSLSLGQKRRNPPPPPSDTEGNPPPPIPRKSVSMSLAIPNTYVKQPRKRQEEAHKTARKLSDSDHDYEFVDDVMFY
ncbi:protein THEMIS2 [Trichomycterus rosablanca]|uniref:protein THEMIS2 n=1 Tax=Trichomycterus rosablanca TaxID=2290929 RepID=UPI002F35E81D